MFNQSALIQEMDHLKKFALRLTGSMPDAEDLLHSTLLRALEKKHLFQDGTDLFSWTSKIMFNLFASQYRRRRKFETQYDPESYIEREFVEAPQEAKAELVKVDNAMKQLSADHREILVLICVKGMKYQDVAESLAIPVGTVRSRLSRAREQLQQILDTPLPAERKPFVPPYPHAVIPESYLNNTAIAA